MYYAGSEYRLMPITPESYVEYTQRYMLIRRGHDLADTLDILLGDEASKLARLVLAHGGYLQDSYGAGGGSYSISVGIGIASLRSENTQSEIPPVAPMDWDGVLARERELRSRPDMTTLETISTAALPEIAAVNSGYIEGFNGFFGKPRWATLLVYTGLGALHAHDLMHQASQRG